MKESTRNTYRERVLRVLLHIQEHLDDHLELEDLARVANFSPFHFHRVFRGLVGESLAEHVRRLRLERAAHRLARGDASVGEIAREAGYDAPESFSRAFRQWSGESPSDYRDHGHARDGGCATERLAPVIEPAPALEVEVEEREEVRVAFIRHLGPYDRVAGAWARLMSWAGRRGHFTGRVKMYGLSHDDPDVTEPDRIRYDACLAVSGEVEPEGEVGVQTIPGGRHARYLHAGPYEGFSDAYAAVIGRWIPAHGHELRWSPCIEEYLNSPMSAAPADLRTVLHIPIE